MSTTPTQTYSIQTCTLQTYSAPTRPSDRKQAPDQKQASASSTNPPVSFHAKPSLRKGTNAIQKAHIRKVPIQKRPIQKRPIQNRVAVLLVHIPIFSIRGQARLAEDIGVSRSTISRLVSGRINPSYRLARAVTDALERRLGRPLDMRDIFSTDGTYLTPSGCGLCQCNGCLPEQAWGEDGTLKPEWRGARPGEWSCARPANTNFSATGCTGEGKEAQ
jgi:DNA-binding XRE family transcriptional regulator